MIDWDDPYALAWLASLLLSATAFALAVYALVR